MNFGPYFLRQQVFGFPEVLPIGGLFLVLPIRSQLMKSGGGSHGLIGILTGAMSSPALHSAGQWISPNDGQNKCGCAL